MSSLKNICILITALVVTSCGSRGQSNFDLSIDEFEKAVIGKDVQLVDVRTTGEYRQGHIDDALNVDWNGDDFGKQVSTLDKHQPVYVYCLSGVRSASAAEHMRNAGFEKVYEFSGGMMAWRNAKKPEMKATGNAAGNNTGMTVDEYNKQLQTDKLVLVDFYAPWCAPCKKMEPFLEELSNERKTNLNIIRINSDDNAIVTSQLKVEALPTLILYHNGKQVWRNVGFISKSDLVEVLNDHAK